MKYLIALIIAGLLGISAVAQDKHNDTKQTQGTQAICPVMGEPIDKNIYVDYVGKHIYVCCQSCVDIVKANPEKYIDKLEKQGVVLEEVNKDTQVVKDVKQDDNNQNHDDSHQHQQ